MALVARVSLTGIVEESPEDILSSALHCFGSDEAANIHGDAEHGLLYTSPELPKPLQLDLAVPNGEDDRKLFSHYLWNSSLILAELIEAGSLALDGPGSGRVTVGPSAVDFDVHGKSILELGAGTALPSLLATVLGAARVVVTDYPAPTVLETLRANVARNTSPDYSPLSPPRVAPKVVVEGHAWGELDTSLARSNRHAFDRIIVADCLWMSWQHSNLLASISWFLEESSEARVWLAAGFHTGRAGLREFFQEETLSEYQLELESIWERDVDGVERKWADERPNEVGAGEKRWLVLAILKRGPAGIRNA